jgi:hypothetical protein
VLLHIFFLLLLACTLWTRYANTTKWLNWTKPFFCVCALVLALFSSNTPQENTHQACVRSLGDQVLAYLALSGKFSHSKAHTHVRLYTSRSTGLFLHHAILFAV